MKEWHLNIDSWPGPNRKKWPGLRDVIMESPDGRYLAVLYSCGEIGINKEVGFFALFEGPTDSPKLLLRPRGLTCLVSGSDETTIQWIEQRFCIVTPYCNRPSLSLSGKYKSFCGSMVFDVKERKVAYVPGAFSGEIISEIPNDLKWRGWRRLSWWPRLWHQ
jgi:hypothetical protein